MNNNYILRGKNIKAVQITMTTIQPVMIHEYTVYLCYIYIHVYIKYMPKFQLIYIISHMRWKNSTCTHKKIKRTLKFMKVINKYIYILNIFSTQSILFTWSKNGRWSPNTIINNNTNKNKTCKWSLKCYMVIKWKTSNKYFTYTIIDMSLQ